MTVGIEVIQGTAIIVVGVIRVREAIFVEEIIHPTRIREEEAEREAGAMTEVLILQCQRK